MPEDGKKAAAVIIPVGLGLGLVGILAALAWAAPPAPPTTRLFGYVTDKITGAPIVGVYGIVYQDKGVETWDYPFTTDPSGYYEITDMLYDADLTQMVIYASGYETYTNENVPISEGDNELNIRMSPE